MDFDKEDEAEKVTRLAYAQRSKLTFWIAGIVFGLYLVARFLHWILGFPSSVEELNIVFATVVGLIYFDLFLERLSVRRREVRIRLKEINRRLEQIESQIDSDPCAEDSRDDEASKSEEDEMFIAKYRESAINPVNAPLSLTPHAVAKVREIMASRDPLPAGLRIGVVGDGRSGLQYSVSFENQGGMMDKVFTFDGLKVFVDATSMMYLNGCTVDYVETLEAVGFKFDNPRLIPFWPGLK